MTINQLLKQSFQSVEMENRLGQKVQLGIYLASIASQDYFFVTALDQKASSLVAKNAEHFVFQLREKYSIDLSRAQFIEVRGHDDSVQFFRWRFEWVGRSPVSARCELIAPSNQIHHLARLLNMDMGLDMAMAQ